VESTEEPELRLVIEPFLQWIQNDECEWCKVSKS